MPIVSCHLCDGSRRIESTCHGYSADRPASPGVVAADPQRPQSNRNGHCERPEVTRCSHAYSIQRLRRVQRYCLSGRGCSARRGWYRVQYPASKFLTPSLYLLRLILTECSVLATTIGVYRRLVLLPAGSVGVHSIHRIPRPRGNTRHSCPIFRFGENFSLSRPAYPLRGLTGRISCRQHRTLCHPRTGSEPRGGCSLNDFQSRDETPARDSRNRRPGASTSLALMPAGCVEA